MQAGDLLIGGVFTQVRSAGGTQVLLAATVILHAEKMKAGQATRAVRQCLWLPPPPDARAYDSYSVTAHGPPNAWTRRSPAHKTKLTYLERDGQLLQSRKHGRKRGTIFNSRGAAFLVQLPHRLFKDRASVYGERRV
eukprot:scaffold897_cov402-Prasinococcus_capsulatus_cf.AAC.38